MLNTGQTSFYDDLRNFLTPSSSDIEARVSRATLAANLTPGSSVQAAGLLNAAYGPGANAAVATAPINAYAQPPIQQENKTQINQYFDVKPDQVARSASDGAKAGMGKALDKSADMLSAQAAVSRKGG